MNDKEFTDSPSQLPMAIALVIGLLVTLAAFKLSNPFDRPGQWLTSSPPAGHNVTKLTH
jgi:hypothetical protein